MLFVHLAARKCRLNLSYYCKNAPSHLVTEASNSMLMPLLWLIGAWNITGPVGLEVNYYFTLATKLCRLDRMHCGTGSQHSLNKACKSFGHSGAGISDIAVFMLSHAIDLVFNNHFSMIKITPEILRIQLFLIKSIIVLKYRCLILRQLPVHSTQYPVPRYYWSVVHSCRSKPVLFLELVRLKFKAGYNWLA